MPEEEDVEIMTPYEDYSVDELKESLKKIFFLSELNDADLAEMDQIMEILREKDPLPPGRSAEESWEEFKSLYMQDPEADDIHSDLDSEEVSDTDTAPNVVAEFPDKENASPARPKLHRKLIRVALIAAIIMVFFAAVTATAAAMGYNLWGWLPIWGNEDLRFVAETPTREPHQDDLKDIPMVLASLGITEPLYPTWLPEDLKRTETKTFEEPLFLLENYQGNDRELTITISPASGLENTIYQKTDNPPFEYHVGSKVHYIFENTDEIITIWFSEEYSVLISGNISIDEMKKVIDSVYEVKE